MATGPAHRSARRAAPSRLGRTHDGGGRVRDGDQLKDLAQGCLPMRIFFGWTRRQPRVQVRTRRAGTPSRAERHGRGVCDAKKEQQKKLHRSGRRQRHRFPLVRRPHVGEWVATDRRRYDTGCFRPPTCVAVAQLAAGRHPPPPSPPRPERPYGGCRLSASPWKISPQIEPRARTRVAGGAVNGIRHCATGVPARLPAAGLRVVGRRV